MKNWILCFGCFGFFDMCSMLCRCLLFVIVRCSVFNVLFDIECKLLVER